MNAAASPRASADPSRALPPGKGELGAACGECPIRQALSDDLAGANREISAWRVRNAELTRDVEAEARRHEHWLAASELFDFWRRHCLHSKARFNAARFQLVLPFLQKDGPAIVRQAILGAAFDPFVTTRKNGSKKRHDDWELIFRNRGKFEEFASRAPANGHRANDELTQMTISALASIPEDERPTQERLSQAVALANQMYRERSNA